MIEKGYLKYIAPPLLFIFMLLDAHVNRLFTHFFNDSYQMNAHVMILVLLVVSEFLDKRFMIGTMLVIGILYDLYYIGVIGIYAVILPLITVLIYLFGRVIQQNLLTLFFSMIIFVTFFELGSTLIQMVFQLAQVNNRLFVTRFLGPTLGINILFFIFLIFPIRKIFVEKESRLN